MGSSVTITGRVRGKAAADIVEGRVTVGNGRIPKVVKVEPNDNAKDEGFTVDGSAASDEENQAFWSGWKGPANVDNADKAADKAYKEAKDKGASDATAKKAADKTRVRVTKKAMKKYLQKNKKKYPNMKIVNSKKPKKRKTKK